MFKRQIGKNIPEVSHKLIEKPETSVYFNHIHNHCELLLFLSGDADYNIDGKVFTPSPYDLLLIPGATYHYLIPTSSAPYENYVIGVDVDILGKDRYEKLFSSPLMVSIKDCDEIKGFFTRLDFYNSNYTDEDFNICSIALIKELLVYLSYQKDTLTSSHSGKLDRISEIIDYISDNIEKPLDADTIADHFSISKSYLQNTFSQNMHIGIKKYIMQKKIYAARSDLLRGMHPNKVCEKYSFGDYSVFYRLYKKTFDSSPIRSTYKNASY